MIIFFSFVYNTANMPLKRPVRNVSQIQIRRLNDVVSIWSVDTRFSPDVYYINTTLVFYARTAVWTPGLTYYVTLAEGVATSDQACGAEAGSFGSKNDVYLSFNSALFFLW